MIDYVEGELKTFEWNGKTFGILICNDLWATPGYTTMPNPYLPWKLKQMGAKFIVHCINSVSSQKYKSFHESSAELWAYPKNSHLRNQCLMWRTAGQARDGLSTTLKSQVVVKFLLNL